MGGRMGGRAAGLAGSLVNIHSSARPAFAQANASGKGRDKGKVSVVLSIMGVCLTQVTESNTKT
jgi:hypothetical protein